MLKTLGEVLSGHKQPKLFTLMWHRNSPFSLSPGITALQINMDKSRKHSVEGKKSKLLESRNSLMYFT